MLHSFMQIYDWVIHTTIQKFGVEMFFNEINAFIQQGCKLIDQKWHL